MGVAGRNGHFDRVYEDFRLQASGNSYCACHLPVNVRWDGADADLARDDADVKLRFGTGRSVTHPRLAAVTVSRQKARQPMETMEMDGRDPCQKPQFFSLVEMLGRTPCPWLSLV